MSDCSEDCLNKFNNILMKLVSYKIIQPGMADRAKIQYSKFISTVVKENRSEFANLDKVKQRLDTFLFAFVLVPTYNFRPAYCLQDITDFVAWSGPG